MTKNAIRVLVAEDEEHIGKLILFKLGKDGYETTWVKNGREATEKVAGAGPWNVVVLDVMMPEMDGWEALKVIRASPAGKALPVLMLTAKAQARDQAEAMRLGASEFLAKPFDPAELSKVVGRLAGREAQA